MKKRIFSFLLAATLLALMLPTETFAAVGDVAGDYYSTDIVTYVNGSPIDSINVGGRTLISAEDMAYHGFTVVWNGEARTLRIAKGGADTPGGPYVTPSSKPVGTRLGSYYYTDIVTYLDEKIIDSYNTGGRTYICAEDMAGFGYSVVWDGNARTLTVKTSSADVEPVEARLIVPHVGASNNSWATLVIENKTDSAITLKSSVYVNGYGCWVEGKTKDITLKAHYTYHIPVRNGLVYGERSTVKANMYLDNNSKAEFRIVYNGKTYYGECDVNGNTTLKRR